MAVKIRLSRTGKKHVPFYRLVVVDSRKKRDGAYLANLGTYDALNGSLVQFHEGLYNEWLAKGAVLTDSAKKVYKVFKKDGIKGAASAEAVEAKPVKKAKPVAKKAVEETVVKEEQVVEAAAEKPEGEA